MYADLIVSVKTGDSAWPEKLADGISVSEMDRRHLDPKLVFGIYSRGWSVSTAGSRRCRIGNRWLNLQGREHSRYRSGARIFGPARSGIQRHPRQRPPYYGACRRRSRQRRPTKHYRAKALPKLPASFQLGLYHMLPLISDCWHATQRNVWARVKHRIVKTEIRVSPETECPPTSDRHGMRSPLVRIAES